MLFNLREILKSKYTFWEKLFLRKKKKEIKKRKEKKERKKYQP